MNGSSHRLPIRAVVLVFFSVVLLICSVLVTYRTVPSHNIPVTYFDTVIVLGSPPDPDGKASPEQRERVLEAVSELQAGHAGAIIVSGGETLPGLVEADTMAQVAEAAGVPLNQVIEERQARNTLQNIFFSRQIMRRHGWGTAEVVTSPSHLPRTALILEHWDLGWRVRASRWPPSYTWQRIAPYYLHEAVGTTALRWFGFPASPFLPEQMKGAGVQDTKASGKASSESYISVDSIGVGS